MRNITPHSVTRKLSHLALVLSAAALPFLCWKERVGQVLMPVWLQGRSGDFAPSLREHDQGFLAAAPSGNAVLRVMGLDPKNPEHLNLVRVMYFRGAYTLYPRRLFAVPPGTIVDDAPDILSAGFNPPQEWLQQNGIQTVITCFAGSDGQPQIGVAPVSSSSEGR